MTNPRDAYTYFMVPSDECRMIDAEFDPTLPTEERKVPEESPIFPLTESISIEKTGDPYTFKTRDFR